ncbi:MAG TPA: hypothetical protein VLH41_02350 [Thermoanaerobaculia bacterium]|nr:hypothetical protein [Thermoanaerobaculia bacterium]
MFLNDPAGRGERLVTADPPVDTERGPWGFRVEGRAPEPRAYAPDTRESLYWQLASALDRGKRLWSERLPSGEWIPGSVLPAVPAAGTDLNAYYDRKALRFFRDVDEKTGQLVQAGDSPDVVTHEQGHAILDAARPDLWDAPHFEVAAFHEAFGDLAAILVALAEPALAESVFAETRGELSRSNLVSRLAEELGAAIRNRYGPDAALPRSLRDAVNEFRYVDPATLPDAAPARELSAEPHSFCRVMTGGLWDALVVLFHSSSFPTPTASLSAAAASLSRHAVAAAETAPPGADFFERFASRIVREARAADNDAAPVLAEAFFRRGLIGSLDVPEELRPDEDPGVVAPPEGEPVPPSLARAIAARLPPAKDGEILTLPRRGERGRRQLRGRRVRDLVLRGPEYGPADGAAVEISDSFALDFGSSGILRASRVHRAGDRDEEDARAFVRHLARMRRIAETADALPESEPLAREGKSHAVVREADGVRRLRRVWISKGGT